MPVYEEYTVICESPVLRSGGAGAIIFSQWKGEIRIANHSKKGKRNMSNRERAIQLLDIIDEERMVYVVRILENLTGFAEIPNAETAAAIEEGDKLLESGTGQRYEGATEDFFHALLRE